ncbi:MULTISPECIES: hypothetical protein [Lysobacter]|uniref:hypothetical protein n=1 Tax=Lysobacter TaxID=68 RepID=UPI001269A906|nr:MULTISPECIES: hypothetical protein [Lysobacter]
MQSKVSSNNASRTKNNNSEPFHSDPSALRRMECATILFVTRSKSIEKPQRYRRGIGPTHDPIDSDPSTAGAHALGPVERHRARTLSGMICPE